MHLCVLCVSVVVGIGDTNNHGQIFIDGKVMVPKEGRVVFKGSVEEFKTSELPAIKELATLDHRLFEA